MSGIKFLSVVSPKTSDLGLTAGFYLAIVCQHDQIFRMLDGDSRILCSGEASGAPPDLDMTIMLFCRTTVQIAGCELHAAGCGQALGMLDSSTELPLSELQKWSWVSYSRPK